MGYLDAQASARDAERAVAEANTAKAAAENAIQIANQVTASAPMNQQQAAKQQQAVNAAQAAISAYETAAKGAAEMSRFATDWFGLGDAFLKESGLDQKLYTPVTGMSAGSVSPISKTVVSVTYVGTGANRKKVTTWSDGSVTEEAAPDTSAMASDAAALAAKRQSAWTVLKDKFESWGLGSLAESVKQLILDGASDEEVTIKLRATPEYAKRFAGNVDRKKAGLNVYDEGTYLALENAYAETFTSYGQQGLLGKTAEEKQANFATYIGGTIAPTEIKRRLQVATDLAASDSATKAAIKQLYPMITDGDLVAYFLKPSETLPKLEVKAQAAKIGGAFLKQGLATDAVSAEEYVAAGVTEEQAQAGAAAVAEVLPRGEFLSDITAGAPDYTQKTAEEVYLKGLASAKRAQDQLRQAEIGRFSGSSGTNKTSLSEQKFGLI